MIQKELILKIEPGNSEYFISSTDYEFLKELLKDIVNKFCKRLRKKYCYVLKWNLKYFLNYVMYFCKNTNYVIKIFIDDNEFILLYDINKKVKEKFLADSIISKNTLVHVNHKFLSFCNIKGENIFFIERLENKIISTNSNINDDILNNTCKKIFIEYDRLSQYENDNIELILKHVNRKCEES